ncbi:hypothetical protein Gorai_013547 [Gossypium raimondii]|uniref:CCHC-type domain-containing protein n=1 Tax=Gossypium raimondii TaxID=29730 RepID=A0A7J8Q5M4_GOSRA|nr:hypothetical protein [Gossypium raimondii]
MCTKSLLKFIGSITGIVAKIDWNTNNSCKGQFARLTVYVELGKSLVSKIIIDGKLQRVEYESLPMVCLDCGRFGNSQEECPHKSSQETTLEGGGKITSGLENGVVGGLKSGATSGSRFRIIGEIFRNKNLGVSRVINDIKGEQDSSRLIRSSEEVAKEARKIVGPIKNFSTKNGLEEYKRKGVLVMNGLKPKPKILKPSNNFGRSFSRISGDKADVVIVKLGFENSFKVEALGFVSGLSYFGMMISRDFNAILDTEERKAGFRTR